MIGSTSLGFHDLVCPLTYQTHGHSSTATSGRTAMQVFILWTKTSLTLAVLYNELIPNKPAHQTKPSNRIFHRLQIHKTHGRSFYTTTTLQWLCSGTRTERDGWFSSLTQAGRFFGTWWKGLILGLGARDRAVSTGHLEGSSGN